MPPKPTIYPLPNGPLVYKDPASMSPAAGLATPAGDAIPNQPYLALCRCGGSKTKPFCDGSHAANGFRSEPPAGLLPDRRDTYAGREIAVHDNRSICSHAGLCTDRLAAVFREDREPWIDPDGAAARAVIEAVRNCPSGALSYSVGPAEAPDPKRPPRVVVTKDGPYAIEGGIELLGARFADGASREHYCLCRCGASANKPFCDGSHWAAKFADDPAPR